MARHLLLGIVILMHTCVCAQDKIVLGFVADFSANSKDFTKSAFESAKLAVKRINDSGQVGKTLVLIEKDGGNDPERHYRLFKEVVREHNAVAIFGGAASNNVIRASQAARELEIPYLVSLGNSSVITVEKGHPFVFQFQPDSWMEASAQSVVLTMLPWKRFAWVGPDYGWARTLLNHYKSHIRKTGMKKEIVFERWHKMDTLDFTSLIDELLAQKPEALILGTWGEDLMRFYTQANKKGFFKVIPSIGHFSLSHSIRSKEEIPVGVWGYSRGPFHHLADRYALASEFTKEYLEAYGLYPNGFGVTSYDSFLAWLEAYKQAGSEHPKKLAGALRKLEFESLRGNLYIRENTGQLNCPVYYGRLTQTDKYPFPVFKPIYALKAEQLWMSDLDIANRRKNQQ